MDGLRTAKAAAKGGSDTDGSPAQPKDRLVPLLGHPRGHRPRLTPTERGGAVGRLASQSFQNPDGLSRSFSRATLDRWVAAYRSRGLVGIAFGFGSAGPAVSLTGPLNQPIVAIVGLTM